MNRLYSASKVGLAYFFGIGMTWLFFTLHHYYFYEVSLRDTAGTLAMGIITISLGLYLIRGNDKEEELKCSSGQHY